MTMATGASIGGDMLMFGQLLAEDGVTLVHGGLIFYVRDGTALVSPYCGVCGSGMLRTRVSTDLQ